MSVTAIAKPRQIALIESDFWRETFGGAAIMGSERPKVEVAGRAALAATPLP